MEDPVAVNRANWDERVPIHLASAFYDVEGFVAGSSSLQPFEVAELGEVGGRELVHLQCHLGLDTLSWARLGARVTGLDFSAPAVAAARSLAARIGVDADFVCADVYDASAALGRTFEVVYTGHGALTWLGNLDRWAAVVDTLLAPGGTFYLAEFHPVAQALADDALCFTRSYFHTREPTVWDEPGTYAEPTARTVHNRGYEWTHPLSEVVSVLTARGLRLEFLHERPFTLFPRFPFLERRDDGTYRLPADRPPVPLSYSLKATKPVA